MTTVEDLKAGTKAGDGRHSPVQLMAMPTVESLAAGAETGEGRHGPATPEWDQAREM